MPASVCRTLHILSHLILYATLEARTTRILILQMRKLKHRGVEKLAHGHTVKKRWSLNSKPGNLASRVHGLKY